MKHPTETTKYAQMGIAALLPGMRFMIERMQKEYDELSATLERLQSGHPAAAPGKRGGSWGNMTAEERSDEMRRRQAVSVANKAIYPSNKTHPDHDAWRAKVSTSRKKAWAALSPAKQKAHLAKMRAGKQRNQGKKRVTKVLTKVNGKMEQREAVA